MTRQPGGPPLTGGIRALVLASLVTLTVSVLAVMFTRGADEPTDSVDRPLRTGLPLSAASEPAPASPPTSTPVEPPAASGPGGTVPPSAGPPPVGTATRGGPAPRPPRTAGATSSPARRSTAGPVPPPVIPPPPPQPPAPPPPMTADHENRNSWQSGFIARLTVRNTGTATDDWTVLVVHRDGVRFESSWVQGGGTARAVAQGPRFTFTGRLAPGASIVVEYLAGRPGGVSTMPVSCTVDGAGCR